MIKTLKTLCVCLSAVLLLCVGRLSPAVGAEQGTELIVGTPERVGEGGDIYCLPVWIYPPPAGAVCGLLLTAQLSEGWRILRVEAGGQEVSYLTLTVREIRDGVRILLDGLPGEPSDRQTDAPLVRLVAEHCGGEGEACTVTLTADSPLYYMEDNGNIYTCAVMGCTAEITGTGEDPPADTRITEETQPSIQPTTEAVTVSTQPTDTRAEQGRAGGYVPVGCREAVCADGLSVEFLFLSDGGAGEGVPTVWLTDCPGGYVTLRRTCGDGYEGWVFGGLPQTGRITFMTTDADGRLYTAVYTNGMFTVWICL